MRTLAWKMFLSFWIVQTFFFAMAALLYGTFGPPLPGISAVQGFLSLCERNAVRIYEQSGSAALDAYLREIHSSFGAQLFIVDSRGTTISSDPIPDEELLSLQRTLRSGKPEYRARDGILVLAHPIAKSGKTEYATVVMMPINGADSESPNTNPIRDLAFGILISGVVCFLLSRYLTAPIARLRVAAQQISSGNLAARAGKPKDKRGDEIGQLVGDFDRMADQMEGLVRVQKRLISDVSHELRSPLTRINLALELIRKVDHPGVATAIQRLERETGRLNEMIGKLLAISQVDAKGRVIEKVNLQLEDLIREVVADADYEARSEQRRVILREVESCRVFGNAEMLRSALENVIRNAIRYTAPGSDVEVSLKYHPTENESMARIAVRDHGPGVPQSSLEDLFRPFYRLDDSRERTTGGVGLGLAITKQAVVLHGGKVVAHNTPSGGLEIQINLPADPSIQLMVSGSLQSQG
jgi:two-component system sensor histidine kinase CpxA